MITLRKIEMKPSYNILLLLCILSFIPIHSQTHEFELWEGKIPNAIQNSDYQEIRIFQDSIVSKVKQVSIPTLTLFQPKNPNGSAILIFPGGGYEHLTMSKEGFKVAEWLNTLGITAIVVKYRLPSDLIMNDKSIGPFQDAQEAMRVVRRNADKWQIDTEKIGVLGFSAGGHMAATVSVRYNDLVYDVNDAISAKPNFSILVYPVISMESDITHNRSKSNLLGHSPTQASIETYSNEKQVNASTPMTFLVHATDDSSVPVENSLRYFDALKNHKVPVELHVYENGGHGFGLGRNGTNEAWTTHCEIWLRSHHYID